MHKGTRIITRRISAEPNNISAIIDTCDPTNTILSNLQSFLKLVSIVRQFVKGQLKKLLSIVNGRECSDFIPVNRH